MRLIALTGVATARQARLALDPDRPNPYCPIPFDLTAVKQARSAVAAAGVASQRLAAKLDPWASHNIFPVWNRVSFSIYLKSCVGAGGAHTHAQESE